MALELKPEEKENIVDGYLFRSAEDADLALQEGKKVQYLSEHMDMNDLEMIQKVYQKAVEMRTFRTPVGMKFVYELRQRLIELGVEEGDISPIPIYQDFHSRLRTQTPTVNKRIQPKKKKDPISKTTISIILNVLLVILVLGMFYIAKTGNNPNILNYEENLVNKYASWEQELTDREAVIREKEQSLQIEQK